MRKKYKIYQILADGYKLSYDRAESVRDALIILDNRFVEIALKSENGTSLNITSKDGRRFVIEKV